MRVVSELCESTLGTKLTAVMFLRELSHNAFEPSFCLHNLGLEKYCKGMTELYTLYMPR